MTIPLIKDVNLFLDDKPSVYALREKAKQTLLSTGFPTKKTESWKYTDIQEILKQDFIVDTSEHTCENDCCHHEYSEDTPFIELTFCKGKLHIEEYNTPKGITITPLPLALYENEYKQYLLNSFEQEKHPFATLNNIYLEQGVCIYIEKDTKVEKPIMIKYKLNNCEALQLNIHNLIILEKNSSLDLVEYCFSDDNKKHLTNIVNEMYLKNDASLNHYKIQKESASAYCITLNAVKQMENSFYKQFYLSQGAKLSRQETSINLQQPYSTAEIYSAYIAKKDCLTDITTNINHLTANTTSNQYAKAILQKDSKATFQGKIYIAPLADKTNGHQLHKALYLDDNATLNCKPELEIYADDVKCSHGASCGEIDKEQLFYLTSRGINQEDAINMLTAAHLDEIISLIPNPEIKELFVFSK